MRAELVLLAVFIGGLVIGAALVLYGLKLGFKCSYEIRNKDDDDNRGIFAEKQDPAEFLLLDQQDKRNKKN